MNPAFFVRVVNPGEGNREITVSTDNSMLVSNLRAKIANGFGLNAENIRLRYKQRFMGDAFNVGYYEDLLQANSIIHVLKFVEMTIIAEVIRESADCSDEKVYSSETAQTFLDRYRRKFRIPNQLKLHFGGVEIERNQKMGLLEIDGTEALHISLIVIGGD